MPPKIVFLPTTVLFFCFFFLRRSHHVGSPCLSVFFVCLVCGGVPRFSKTSWFILPILHHLDRRILDSFDAIFIIFFSSSCFSRSFPYFLALILALLLFYFTNMASVEVSEIVQVLQALVRG